MGVQKAQNLKRMNAWRFGTYFWAILKALWDQIGVIKTLSAPKTAEYGSNGESRGTNAKRHKPVEAYKGTSIAKMLQPKHMKAWVSRKCSPQNTGEHGCRESVAHKPLFAIHEGSRSEQRQRPGLGSS